jgi:hypothetical protein
LLLSALWIGGLLGAVVWRIRYRCWHFMANVTAALISFASGIVAAQLIHGAVWNDAGLRAWTYHWFEGFIICVIEAAFFWAVLLAGIRAGISLLFVLLVSSFIGSLETIAILGGALFISLPVGSIGVIARELLRANLPDKYFRQFCFTPRQNRTREIVDESYKFSIGHVPEW